MRHAVQRGLALLLLCVMASLPAGALAALKELLLPAGLLAVEAGAFERAGAIERVVVPAGTVRIGSRAFADSSLREIVLPASVTDIASDAFSGCSERLLAIVEQGSYAASYCAWRGIYTNWTIVPPTPEGPYVRADSAGEASVMFYWPQGADRVRIWRAGGGSAALVLCAELNAAGPVGTGTSYTDSGLTPSTTYAYCLESVAERNGRVFISEKSAAGWVTLPAPPRKTDYSDVIWQKLTQEWGFTAAQAAGIMGNIYAECTYCPRNAQDDRYPGLDNGAGNEAGSPVYVYDVYDGVGYGICQWTYPSRKQGLLNKAITMGTTVEDIDAQLAFLKDELDGYMGVSFTAVIRQMNTLEEVSDLILRDFESPIGWESRVEQRRAYGRQAYAMFAGR